MAIEKIYGNVMGNKGELRVCKRPPIRFHLLSQYKVERNGDHFGDIVKILFK